MKRVRELGLVLLTAAVIFFAMQNLDSVDVAFLWFEGSLPLSIIALVPLLIGLLVGAGTAIVFGHRKGKEERERMRELKTGAAEEVAEEDEAEHLLSEGEQMPADAEAGERANSERSQ